MSLLPASSIGDESTGFYNGVATQSLRFDRASSSYCIRQNSTATDSQKWTLSVWLKRTTLGAEAGILGSSSTAEYVRFESDDTIRYRLFTSSAQQISMITNAVFRDTTNFFHFVCAVDLSNTTDNDKVIMYANGTRLTLGTNTTTSTDTFDSLMNDNNAYWNLGRYTQYYGGYMSDVHIIDGQQLTPTSFAETKNGVWIAKAYTGSYGNNGARLEFKQIGSGSSANASGIGADTSTNTNHFYAYNVDAHDSNMPDSPENNFATLLPLRSGENASSQTFSEGNLQWTSSTYGYNATGSSINIPTSGKWYFELYVKTHGTGESHDFGVGLQGVKFDSMSKTNPATATYGDSTHYITRRDFGSRIEKNLDNVYIGTNPGTGTPDESDSTVNYNQGKIVQLAFDADSGKVYWGLDDTYWDDDVSTDGNPSSGTNETTSLTSGVEYFFTLQQYSNTYVSVTNFGQDSSFAGNKTSGSANGTDANGIGDFYYDPPTGFLALCSSNLPDTTLSPAENEQANHHFDITTYTATGGSSDSAGQAPARDIAGFNFQPDWVIIKGRSYADWGMTFDSNRGVGKTLQAFRNYSEGDYANTLTAFNSDGFSLGADSTAQVNWRQNNYVSWNWHCNSGSTSTNDAGSIDGTQQVNTTAGYSITTFTANNNTKCTIGHGLSQAPNMVFIKNRSSSSNGQWTIGQDMYTGFTGQLYIDSGSNGTAAFSTNSGSFDNTAPTSTLVTINTDNTVNEGTDSFVMYCFHSVEGYSKFGSYVGNNSTDGTFVYTGFRPAFVMCKYASGSGEDWIVWDRMRDPDNLVHNKLYWNTSNAEITDTTNRMMDFVSNGFKHRTDHVSTNGNGGTYMYMAFAEQPFKFSNAR